MLVAALVLAVTLVVFLPAVGNDFVNWDDLQMVVINPGAHGLGWSNIVNAFTSTWFNHYHPITWLSFGLDHVIWGLDPRGFHLTNVVLHALSAGVVFLLARRLLSAARGETGLSTDAAAAVAALAFSLHPLRVEAVAWVTARRDALSGLFFFLTILAYTHAVGARRAERGPVYRRRLALALIAYVAALLSKSITMTLPAVLLILDWYPLRRDLGDRRVWLEKLPFAVLGGAAALGAVLAVGTGFTSEGPGQRLAMAGYSFVFYVWKTVLPLGLSVIYELPEALDPFDPRFVVSMVLTASVTAAAVALRRDAPWLAAAWAYYVVTLLPVSGLAHAGYQLVYLRYSYLPCAVWAVLLGAAFAAAIAAWRAGVLRTQVFVIVCASVVLVLAGWAELTRRQVLIWRNSETLWTAALAADPTCVICHHNLGTYYMLSDRPVEGEAALRRALALRPGYEFAAHNLARILLVRGIARHDAGEYEEAVQLLSEAQTLRPGDPELRHRLAEGRAALAARRPSAPPD